MIFISMFWLIGVCSCLNLITNFPNNLYISSNDIVGYKLKRFVNGTRIESEVFPEPIVSTPVKDDILRDLQELKDCRNIRVGRPLEVIAICRTSIAPL
jgi:hypothetical protein